MNLCDQCVGEPAFQICSKCAGDPVSCTLCSQVYCGHPGVLRCKENLDMRWVRVIEDEETEDYRDIVAVRSP